MGKGVVSVDVNLSCSVLLFHLLTKKKQIGIWKLGASGMKGLVDLLCRILTKHWALSYFAHSNNESLLPIGGVHTQSYAVLA